MIEAPLYEDIAGGPDGGAAHWVQTSDDVRIRVGHWPAANAKGTILLFPGRTEYIEKYGRTAKEFVERGFSCVAIDWRGQGIADRVHPNPALGHVGNLMDYQRDVAALMAHVAELGLPKPYFLIGHSMGGAIGLQALIDGLDVTACGFSAPMWGAYIPPLVRAYGWVASQLALTFGFTHRIAPQQFETTYVLRAPFAGNTLTTDEGSWNTLADMATKRSGLALGGVTYGFLATVLRETRKLSKLPSPDIDCLTFVSTNDTIIDRGRIEARMAKWPNGTLKIIDGAEHEMFMDKPEYRNALIDGFTAHFEAHLPK